MTASKSPPRWTPLMIVYGLCAAVALAGTWRENLAFMAQADNGGLFGFIHAAGANAAARSVGIDLAMVCLALFVWMVVEARRLGVRHVWLYLLLSMVVAVSMAFPLFLIARERAIAKGRSAGGTAPA